MTVAELIDSLMEKPQDAEIYIEGKKAFVSTNEEWENKTTGGIHKVVRIISFDTFEDMMRGNADGE